MAEVRLQAVEKRFGDLVVISPLDLVIPEGEFFTFVGPSGCGKSTLLNLIAGIEPVSGGRICFDGEDVTDLAPGRRDVAMVFQSYALYPHMTVRGNLAFPLRNKGAPRARIEEEVERVAAALGLGELLQRKPRELSGGQRQRVALGRALIRKPRVFLMDEPLSNLDARLRLEMREELKRIHSEHRITTVYVTHDQEEAMALSARIAVLDEGRIQQCGTPREVYNSPSNLFVAGFIGSPPMNILDGALFRDVPGIAAVVKAFDERPVLVGVRPADIGVTAGEDDMALAAEVLLLEPTGSETWVVGLWRGQRIKGKAAAGEHLEQGAKVYLRIPTERVYLFDRASGVRLRA